MKQPNILPKTKDQRLKTKYFLYVGNAYPHKNLERLLEAIARIKEQKPEIKLVLVGHEDFFYKKLKEKVAEMKLEQNVLFYGPVKREELPSLYQKALALVFPSLMEGFGLPAIEAIANGCLVLVSDLPVFHEILDEAVLYFNPQDSKNIAEKLEEVYLNPFKYDSLKIQAKSLVVKYSWVKLAQETLKIYQEVNNL